MKTREELIKALLSISPKRRDIEYFNYLTALTDNQLQKEFEKWAN